MHGGEKWSRIWEFSHAILKEQHEPFEIAKTK